MKILVLMPLDEQSSIMALKIYDALPHEIKDKTFCMPAFMDYLVKTEICKNWTYAFFDSLLTAKRLYENTEEEQDLIIIGNTCAAHKFDAVFNFQDIDKDLPYKDNFAEKMYEVVKGEEMLENLIKDLHKAEESKMALHNCIATADFLTAYLKTDPHLGQIKKEYHKKLEELKEKNSAILH